MFVRLHELALVGVGHAADARRQDIVDGQFLVVLLNVYGANLERACCRGRGAIVEALLVASPVGLDKVEGSETQDNRLLEARHVHTDEADGGEIRDAAYGALEFLQRDAELEPSLRFLVAVAQRCCDVTNVGDEVAPDDGVARVYADVVLEIFLVLIEGVVLVDILHVRRCLVGRLVALRRVLGVGRVAFGQVDALVAVEDADAVAVEIRATVVVVVVARWVGPDAIEHFGRHFPLDG